MNKIMRTFRSVTEFASRPKSRAAKKLKVDEVNKDAIQRPKSRAAKTSKTKDESTASTITSSTDSKQKDSEENIPRQVQKVKDTQKTIIYSDDSTMDTFEQASNVTKSSGKGLALLEESLKKESKKKKSSLKFLLNPQVEPEEGSELSSDLEEDEGSTTHVAKRKLKTVTEETLRHYDEVIDFVVKNIGRRSPSLEIGRTEDVMNEEQEKKAVEREPKMSIKTDAKTKTRVADLELDEISEGDLDEEELKSKKSHITEEKVSANSNKIDAKVSDIKNNEDPNSEKLPTKEALQSDVNTEDKEDQNNEIQSDEGDDNDIDAPFTYGGSPYVVLDNLEEPPESEHPAEEDNVCKDTVPFTYEGMPLPKEVIDSCSSIGSGSNYPSPKPSDLPIENNEELKVKKNARDNESQKAKDEDDSNQSHVDVVTVDNVENEANTRKENVALKDAVISDKESDIEVNVDDSQSNKITNKLETIPEETHSPDEVESATDDKGVAKKIKETDTVIKSKLKGKKSVKETEIASEKIKKSNETSKHVTDDSTSEKSLKANESEKESEEEDSKSERSVKMRGRKRKTSKEENRTVPKRRKSSKTMEETTKESTQKRGDKNRRQKNIEEELLESEANLKKRRGRPSSANARGRQVEAHAKRNLKRKAPMSHAEMKSCKVRVVDCKFTLLQPNVHPNVLLTAGISRVRNLKVLSIKNPISKLKETNTDVKSKQTYVESKSILESKKKDIEPDSTKRTEIDIPQKIVRSESDTDETTKSELNKQSSDNDIKSDDDIESDNDIDDKLPEKLNEKESQATELENKLSKKDEVDKEQKVTSRLAKENELEMLTPITEKTKQIIVESEAIVKQVTTKSVIVLDNIKTTNTSIESSQEKRSQLHQVEERPMAEAQVLVEKMIIPVKTSHVETSKPSSSIEVEEKKPKRIAYTDHKGPILNIKVKKTSVKNRK